MLDPRIGHLSLGSDGFYPWREKQTLSSRGPFEFLFYFIGYVFFTRTTVVSSDDNGDDGDDNGKSQIFFFVFISKFLLVHTIDSLCITIYIQKERVCRTKVLWVKKL